MIKYIHIRAFGKLKNYSYAFNDNMNLILQDNGYGKTTMATFICVMFYGLKKSYPKSIAEDIRAKYTPWGSQDKFGGYLDFEYKGKLYRIDREFGRTPKEDTCVLREVASGKQIETDNIGERLFGLTENDFVNCFFVPQDAVRLLSTDNFSAKLSQMVEGTNCDKAINSLDAQATELVQKKRDKYKQEQGKLPECKRMVDSLRARIEDEKRQRERVENNAKLIAEYRKEFQIAGDGIAQADSAIQNIESSRQNYKVQNQVKEERLNEKQKEIDCLEKCDYDNIPRKIEQIKQLENKSITKKRLLWVGITLLCVGVFMGLAVWYMGVALGCIGIVTLVIYLMQYKKIQKTNKEKFAELLLPIVSTDIDEGKKKLIELYTNYQRLNTELNEIRNQKNKIEFDSNEYDKYQREKACCTERQRSIADKIARLETQNDICINTMGDISELSEQLYATEQQCQKLERQYKVLIEAKNYMQQAKDSLAEAYLPKLSHALSEIIKTITNGKIDRAVVKVEEIRDKGNSLTEFQLELWQGEQQYDVEYFSRGEKEIALFCLRMVLSEQIYGDKIPFVIVDDAFVNYDDNKFATVCDLLRKLSLQSQIVYFSCHNRSKIVK